MSRVYLITGGNRGLGLGLVRSLLARPGHTVIATVRNAQAAEALQNGMKNVTKGASSTLEIISYNFTTAIEPDQVAKTFLRLNIPHIDALILNAGRAYPMVPPSDTTAEDLRAAFETNTIAPLLVFQGLKPYLTKAASRPKLVWITSSIGSVTDMDPFGGGTYGPSRAAQNWLARSIHLEYNGTSGDSRLIAFLLHPGRV